MQPLPPSGDWRIRSVTTFADVGPRGWAKLRELARRRNRSDASQVTWLVRYALHKALEGEDVELSDSELDDLLADGAPAAAALT